jgi:nitrate/nitrite transporter NarK
MFNDLLKSKRVWAALAAVAVVVLKDRTGLSDDQITNLVIAVGSWIVGDSLRATTPKVV